MTLFKETVLVFIKEHIDEIQVEHDKTLTLEEKQNMLTQWLESDPHYFMKQVKASLPMDILTLYYDNLQINDSDNHENRMQPQQTIDTFKKQHNQIRNRRYHYLIHHLRPEEYFSDDSIQLRYPILHQEYIGQYIPKEEKYAPFNDDMTLVDRVYHGMDNRYVQEEYKRYKRSEEETFEEEEDDDEEEEEEEESNDDEKFDNMDDEGLIIAREQKRNELIRLLEERWLDGLDDTFDYSTVDNNELYDDLIQLNQDLQDQYFDEESEEENITNTDTGILDY
ncbi:unnamed protein product [Cunninghamella blakesleeana]